MDSITVIRNASVENELSNKKYIDDDFDKHPILIQSKLEDYLNFFVVNNVYNLAKNDEIQKTDTATINHPNNQGFFMHILVMKCNH